MRSVLSFAKIFLNLRKEMMSASKIIVLLSLALSGCAAEQKQPTQWKVKTTTESQQKIWVTKSDGSLQCKPKAKALTPDAAAAQLKSAGIPVFQSRSGNDGQMHAQRCGSPTGATVDLEISRIDLTKALGRGFVTKTSAAE
jgi:hypothetical protein